VKMAKARAISNEWLIKAAALNGESYCNKVMSAWRMNIVMSRLTYLKWPEMRLIGYIGGENNAKRNAA